MKILLIGVVVFAATSASGLNAQSTVAVRGKVTREGVYVPPHQRTAPNSTATDNWSSRPNVNPYTGKPGKVDPYTPKSYKPYKPR